MHPSAKRVAKALVAKGYPKSLRDWLSAGWIFVQGNKSLALVHRRSGEFVVIIPTSDSNVKIFSRTQGAQSTEEADQIIQDELKGRLERASKTQGWDLVSTQMFT